MSEYHGPERRKHPSDCAFPEKWQEVQDDRRYFRETLTRIETKLDGLADDHDTHVKKMFEGNGKPAIIPSFDKRIEKLEAAMVPRDDVVEMVKAYSVGKRIILGVAAVASIGFAATLFFHLFRKANQ